MTAQEIELLTRIAVALESLQHAGEVFAVVFCIAASLRLALIYFPQER